MSQQTEGGQGRVHIQARGEADGDQRGGDFIGRQLDDIQHGLRAVIR